MSDLICAACGVAQPDGHLDLGCVECAGPLEVRVETPNVEGALDVLKSPERRGLWRYRGLLPFASDVEPVTLGEGDTPVVSLEKWGRAAGVPKTFAKLEHLSPTGSFKDRGSAVLVTRLQELGVRTAVEDSSGNAGASIAAYCAKAGIDAVVFAPESAPAAKLAQISAYGAELHLIGGTRDDVTAAAKRAAEDPNTTYASHNLHPYFLEGTKTFAYEIFEHFGGCLPDHLIIPVGNGSLFLGALKGFRELMAAGCDFDMPRMHIAQVQACPPIVASMDAGRSQPVKVISRRSIAGGICVASPPRGAQVLDALRTNGGTAVAVGERDVWDSWTDLAEMEGLFIEPTSAAAFAALRILRERNVIGSRDSVIFAVTGSGLKDPTPIMPNAGEKPLPQTT